MEQKKKSVFADFFCVGYRDVNREILSATAATGVVVPFGIAFRSMFATALFMIDKVCPAAIITLTVSAILLTMSLGLLKKLEDPHPLILTSSSVNIIDQQGTGKGM